MQGLSLVLTRRGDVLTTAAARREAGAYWRQLAAVTVLGAATYGAVLGSWRDARLAVYDAAKLPLVLLLTVLLTMPFQWMIARLLGAALEVAQVGVLTAPALAIGATLLGSLAPVVALFTACSPPPSSSALATYDLLYILHFSIVGGSCFAGTLTLWRAILAVSPTRAAAARIGLAWLVVDAFVGGEIAWALRPFIGSISLPVAFLRQDAFHGNVFEALVTAVNGVLSSH